MTGIGENGRGCNGATLGGEYHEMDWVGRIRIDV